MVFASSMNFWKPQKIPPIKKERLAIGHIISYMDSISDRILLPQKKFRHIESSVRDDIYEFKYDPYRVYVIKQKPDMYIVLGGYKKNQSKDILRLEARIKDFKLQEP